MGALLVGVSAHAAGPGSAWQGEADCEGLFERLPSSLPGGAVVESRMDDATLYRLPEGGTLRIEGPEVVREALSGATFAEAQADLRERAPFDLRGNHVGAAQGVVLAQVESAYNGEVSLYGDATGFGAVEGGAELLIQPTVHLASWDGYAQASAPDRDRWDRALCEQAHHELGHILVAAQVMTEAEPELAGLTSATREGIALAMRTKLEDMMSAIRRRQERYHAEIKVIGERAADSRPYLEQPFSWLSGSRG